jgi:hypothetical protein
MSANPNVDVMNAGAPIPGGDLPLDHPARNERRATAPGTDRTHGTRDVSVQPKPVNPLDQLRAVVQLEPGQLHEYAGRVERLVADVLYQRGGRLARIGLAPELTAVIGPAISRSDTQAVIVPVSADYLRRLLTSRADFQIYRRREKEFVSVDCPTDLATNIVNMGDWPAFRPLAAIASSPFIRPDLSICERPGYDTTTGIYYRPSHDFPPVPVNPTRTDAEAARKLLLDPFAEFPFDTAASVSVFLAHVITAAVRVALATSPVFFYSAPSPGSGKTLAARMAGLIGTGTDPAMRPYTDDAAEMRKVLFAVLLAGDTGLNFDNVPTGVKVRSPVLCGFTTATTYTDRKLGVSESPSLPNRVLVALTGNNITPVGDLARRSLVCRLVVNSEKATGREFRITDLPTHIGQRRAEMLVAALTIVRAYIAAGQPDVAPPLASFEAWSRIVRDPLIWLGMADPVASQETEADDEVEALRGAFAALCEIYGTKPFMGYEVANDIGAREVRTALAADGCKDPDEAQSVGYWLRANRDRVANGLKLVKAADSHGSGKWQLQRIEGGMGS